MAILKDSGDRREFESGAVRDMEIGKGRCDLLPLHECADLLKEFPIHATSIIAHSMGANGSSLIFDNIASAMSAWTQIMTLKENDFSIDADMEAHYINEIRDLLFEVVSVYLFFDYYCECTENIFETTTLYDWVIMLNKDNPDNKEEALERALKIIPSDAILSLAKHFEDGAKKYGDRNWEKGIPFNVFMDSAVRHYLKIKREDRDEPHGRAFMWNIMCAIWTITNHGFESK